MKKIPKSHPRYNSLMTREKISNAMEMGIVHETGLIAHGRGEAFDYIVGEKTISEADVAERIATAALICAKNPVISVNGNVVALVGKECMDLARSIPAKIEINLFHRSDERIKKISKELQRIGVNKLYGINADKKIPGLDHDRALCDEEGIFSADVILVPLEDGDRCHALRKMGKFVITIDLNPLSRTSRTANITIIDNVIRAIPNIQKHVNKLKDIDKKELKYQVKRWDNNKMLEEVLSFMSKRLNSMYKYG